MLASSPRARLPPPLRDHKHAQAHNTSALCLCVFVVAQRWGETSARHGVLCTAHTARTPHAVCRPAHTAHHTTHHAASPTRRVPAWSTSWTPRCTGASTRGCPPSASRSCRCWWARVACHVCLLAGLRATPLAHKHAACLRARSAQQAPLPARGATHAPATATRTGTPTHMPSPHHHVVPAAKQTNTHTHAHTHTHTTPTHAHTRWVRVGPTRTHARTQALNLTPLSRSILGGYQGSGVLNQTGVCGVVHGLTVHTHAQGACMCKACTGAANINMNMDMHSCPTPALHNTRHLPSHTTSNAQASWHSALACSSSSMLQVGCVLRAASHGVLDRQACGGLECCWAVPAHLAPWGAWALMATAWAPPKCACVVGGARPRQV
jgi:hypothetical protein